MRSIDPDSEENQAATRQNEREVFALQMQAKQDAFMTDQEMIAIIATADAGNHYCCRCEQPSQLFKHGAFFCSVDCAERVSDNTLDCGQTCVPSYLVSLDAMAVAERSLTDEGLDIYYDHLLDICCEFPGTPAYSATAAQRAQAFVRTIAARAEREARRAGE